MYIISACLLGERCRYDGKSKADEKVVAFAKNHNICSVCPETFGGLGIPRKRAEIVINEDVNIGELRVVTKDGRDVTKAFKSGATKAYDKAVKAADELGESIEGAILKSKSPSCGKGKIYDGSFTGRLECGDGVFVQLLMQKDIRVYTEKEKIND